MSTEHPSQKNPKSRPAYFRGTLGFVIVLLLGVAAFSVWQVYERVNGRRGTAQSPSVAAAPTSSPSLYRALDGAMVTSSTELYPPVVGVMIDNHQDARPQSGLSLASVVYEFPVEGMFSRYFAVFPLSDELLGPSSTAKLMPIGPVRSARPYFVAIAKELGALYAHVGGSPEALDSIRAHDVFDVNEYFRGHLFWRERRGGRYAPHNVMTTLQLMERGRVQFFAMAESGTKESWQWSDTIPGYLAPTSTPRLSINWPGNGDAVVWKYDIAANNYQRYRGGKLHKDQDGTGIVADTIIVQHVQSRVLDREGRLRIDVVGEGPAEIYRDGVRISAKWKKADLPSRTQWTDSLGNAIPLRAGKIWVQVVDQTIGVEEK